LREIKELDDIQTRRTIDEMKLLQNTNFQCVDENPDQSYFEDEKICVEKIRKQQELRDLEMYPPPSPVQVPPNRGYEIQNGLVGANRDIFLKL
jgi:hypothetical protein